MRRRFEVPVVVIVVDVGIALCGVRRRLTGELTQREAARHVAVAGAPHYGGWQIVWSGFWKSNPESRPEGGRIGANLAVGNPGSKQGRGIRRGTHRTDHGRCRWGIRLVGKAVIIITLTLTIG